MKNFWERLKEKVCRWLERMGEENEKSFGTGRLDCCQLNKNTNPKRK